MTTTATTTPTRKGPGPEWQALLETLHPEGDGKRFEFFPLKEVPSGSEVHLTLLGPAHFDRAQHHGQFSLLEVDVDHKGTPYRLCVSGTRLARAIANVAPGAGDEITLKPTGDGKERTWQVSLA